jgi:hypothetical protein
MSETSTAMIVGKIASPTTSVVFRLLIINHFLRYGLPWLGLPAKVLGFWGLIATSMALGFLCATPQYLKENKSNDTDWLPLVIEPLHYLLGYLFLYIVL